MSQDLPPVPYHAPIIDLRTMGTVTPVWADWLKKAFVRMGGHLAPTNNDPITTDRITDANVTTAKIADNAVTAAKIASAVAGSGLSGGGGSALSVDVDGATIDVGASGLEVMNGGIAFAKFLASDWSKSLATSGYQKLPSGLYIQWGVTGSISSGTNTAQSFPASFPTACFQVVAGIQGNSAGVTTATGHFGTGGYSASGFTLYNRTSAAYAFNWLAVGH